MCKLYTARLTYAEADDRILAIAQVLPTATLMTEFKSPLDRAAVEAYATKPVLTRLRFGGMMWRRPSPGAFINTYSYKGSLRADG